MDLRPRLLKKYRKILTELSLRKMSKLLVIVGDSKRKLPNLRRPWRDKKIRELEELVYRGYRPVLRAWIKKNTVKREVRFTSRIEKNNKALAVKERLEKKWGRHRHLVYVSFGSGRKCLKVGRSDNGLGRVAGQYAAYYFRDSRRVAVYFPKRKKKKVLPPLECALTHLFRPFHLYQRPAQTKFREKCPACRDARKVKKGAKRLFPT
jgi:hypothetical protein